MFNKRLSTNAIPHSYLKSQLLHSPINKFSLSFFIFAVFSLFLYSLFSNIIHYNYLYSLNYIDNAGKLITIIPLNENNKNNNNVSYTSNQVINTTSLIPNKNEKNISLIPLLKKIDFTNYNDHIASFVSNFSNSTQLSLSLTNFTIQSNLTSQSSVIDSKINQLLQTSLFINNNNHQSIDDYNLKYTTLISENLQNFQHAYNDELIALQAKIDSFTEAFFQNYLNDLANSLNKVENSYNNNNNTTNNTIVINTTTTTTTTNYNNKNNQTMKNILNIHNIQNLKNSTISKLSELHNNQLTQLNKINKQNLIIFPILSILFIALNICKSCISFALQQHDSKKCHYYYNSSFCYKKDDDISPTTSNNQTLPTKFYCFISWLFMNNRPNFLSNLLFCNILAVIFRDLIDQYLNIYFNFNNTNILILNSFLEQISAGALDVLNSSYYNIFFYFNIFQLTLFLLLMAYLLLGHFIH